MTAREFRDSFIEVMKRYVENDEPIQGSDAVEWLVDFFHRAVQSQEVDP